MTTTAKSYRSPLPNCNHCHNYNHDHVHTIPPHYLPHTPPRPRPRHPFLPPRLPLPLVPTTLTPRLNDYHDHGCLPILPPPITRDWAIPRSHEQAQKRTPSIRYTTKSRRMMVAIALRTHTTSSSSIDSKGTSPVTKVTTTTTHHEQGEAKSRPCHNDHKVTATTQKATTDPQHTCHDNLTLVTTYPLVRSRQHSDCSCNIPRSWPKSPTRNHTTQQNGQSLYCGARLTYTIANHNACP